MQNRFPLLLLTASLFVGGAVMATNAEKAFYQKAYPVQYSYWVEEYADKNDLDPALVYAGIRTESSFRPLAWSSVGARGLMQLTEETFEWVAYRMHDQSGTVYEDMFDPEANIRYGTYLLKDLLAEFGTEANALCAYHAGWGNAKNWLSDPQYSPDGKNIETIPFEDTRGYVKKVLDTKEIYQELYQMNRQGG